MKRFTLYIGLMCMLTGWCTSCTNDGGDAMIDSTPVFLSARLTDALRAKSTITDGQPLLQGMQVGVFIRENGGTNAPVGVNLPYMTNASGGLDLQSGSQPCYPSSGRGVAISAYYPYQDNGSDSYDFSVKTDQRSDDDYNASDLLYSTEAVYSRSATAHTLPFEHKLSRVTWSLEAGAGAPDLSGAVVSVLNVYPEVEFNRATGIPGAAKGTKTAIMPNADKAIVVPQTIEANTRLIKVTAGGNDYYYTPAPALTLESGKSYNFTITVKGTGIDISYTVSEWTAGTVNDNGGTIALRSYRVGDYYPDPNVDLTDPLAKAAIQGVVFWVDPTSGGAHGKIVGLKQMSGLQWHNAPSTFIGTTMEDGLKNIQVVANYITSHYLSWAEFPAFQWIHTVINNGTADYSDLNAKGVWCLPSLYELQYLYCAFNGREPKTWGEPEFIPGWDDNATAKAVFNTKLTDAGGAAFHGAYWSSSEDFSGHATYYINFNLGGMLSYNAKLSLNYKTCVISSF